ncbi:hypothetical protein SGF_00904 [Shigella flexneri CDC 796-83]|uniref:Uncharacterized protein n=1 Tax=Shigella flexneri CDC 796-83 TaxID=945360 RepID=A0A6N3QSV7_SHIFL|nr:hypothetical protein SGF_00904 [Shigella flexneri CDC 796-83]
MPATVRQLLDKRTTKKVFPHLQSVTGTPACCAKLNGGQIAPVNTDTGIHFSCRTGFKYPDALTHQFQGAPLHLVISRNGIPGDLPGGNRDNFCSNPVYCPCAGLRHHTGIKTVQIADGILKPPHNIPLPLRFLLLHAATGYNYIRRHQE